MSGRQSQRVPITPQIKQAIRDYIDGTGIGPFRLLRGARDKPPGLTSSMIRTWLTGQARTACKVHLDYALRLWESADPFVPITEEVRSCLEHHRARTRIGQTAFWRMAVSAPPGLSPAIIQAWLAGHTKRARRSHLDYVLKQWEALPSSRNGPWLIDARAATEVFETTRKIARALDCRAEDLSAQ